MTDSTKALFVNWFPFHGRSDGIARSLGIDSWFSDGGRGPAPIRDVRRWRDTVTLLPSSTVRVSGLIASSPGNSGRSPQPLTASDRAARRASPAAARGTRTHENGSLFGLSGRLFRVIIATIPPARRGPLAEPPVENLPPPRNIQV